MGVRLSEEEIQRSMDFCVKLFAPVYTGDHVMPHNVSGAIADAEPVNLESVVSEMSALRHRSIAVAVGPDQAVTEETTLEDRTRARAFVASEFEVSNFERESLEGFVVRLVRGSLGLVRV
jgi:hypothetical protein